MNPLTWIFPTITNREQADHHVGMAGMPVFLMGVSFLMSATLFGLRLLAPLPLVIAMLALALGFFAFGLYLRSSKAPGLVLPAVIVTGIGALISLIFPIGIVDLAINFMVACLTMTLAVNGLRGANWIKAQA